MKKRLSVLKCLLMALIVLLPFTSCSDDKVVDAAEEISGTYSGEMGIIGYSDLARGYVTLTRVSSDAVFVKIICEEFDLDLEEIIMNITSSDSGYSLKSTTKAVTGSVVSKTLMLTFSTEGYTYSFSGSK
jgi:hypothetical protein